MARDLQPYHIINFTVFKIVEEEEQQEGQEPKEEYYAIQWSQHDGKNIGDLLKEKYGNLLKLSYWGISDLIEYSNGREIHHSPEAVWHEFFDGKIFKIEASARGNGDDLRRFKRPKRAREEN